MIVLAAHLCLFKRSTESVLLSQGTSSVGVLQVLAKLLLQIKLAILLSF